MVPPGQTIPAVAGKKKKKSQFSLSDSSLKHGSALKIAFRVAAAMAVLTMALCDRSVFTAVSLKKKRRKKRLQVRARSESMATFK